MHPFLTFGRLHIPVYGVFAAAGLMAAMLLSERTARMAHVDPAALWNAGMATVFFALMSSRLLLVVTNFHTFLQYPLLVLALPSLTRIGLLLTVLMVVLYLRRKRMPILQTLDAAAPCVALLWAGLSLGLLAEGTREGMPAGVPWAIGSALGRIHPVEAYSALCGLLLCGALMLRVRLPGRPAGQVAAEGLAAAGLLVVALDFFRLPAELFDDAPVSFFGRLDPVHLLDPIQWVGVLMFIAGGCLLAVRLRHAAVHGTPPEPEGDLHAL